MDNLTIGLTVRSIRKSKGLSSTDLAEKSGLKVYEISRIEHGNQRLDLEKAIKISEALGISMDELCTAITRAQPQVEEERESIYLALNANKRLKSLVSRLELLAKTESASVAG